MIGLCLFAARLRYTACFPAVAGALLTADFIGCEFPRVLYQ